MLENRQAGDQGIDDGKTQKDHDAVAEISHAEGDAASHGDQDRGELVGCSLRGAEADKSEDTAADGNAGADVALHEGDDGRDDKGQDRGHKEEPRRGADAEAHDPGIEESGYKSGAGHQKELGGGYGGGIYRVKHDDYPFYTLCRRICWR